MGEECRNKLRLRYRIGIKKEQPLTLGNSSELMADVRLTGPTRR
jgi:hypothetical protein